MTSHSSQFFVNTKTTMFLALFIAITATIAAADLGARGCVHTCGPARAPTRLPYPLGFSAGCPVRMNCSAAGEARLGDFPVTSVGVESLKLSIPARCDRPASEARRLFGRNHAPTWRNAILFENCSRASPCRVPSTAVRTHFESPCGGGEAAMSCYSEEKTGGFLDRRNVSREDCRCLSSAIFADETSGSTLLLKVQVLELGWWLDGECRCSPGAICTEILSPVTGLPGFRCRCGEGYAGDGYLAGEGCRKVSSGCNPSKYMSGHCGGTTRFGALIGGITAGACLMIGIGLACCFAKRHSRSKSRKTSNRRLCEAIGISIPIYSYKEIERATGGFSEKQRLGTGAYGTVYAGKLPNDQWVAVKRIKRRDNVEQITNEINLISSVTHPNLVRLLGCSVENGEQILVYEFMPNGTLCEHLERERGSGLSWPARLAIAGETARAVSYLHNSNPPIYHRDIKSSNILLDFDLKSKVGDFGLSRLGRVEISHISTAPQGTPGYLDPQYHQNFHLSDKSDVYSFGVVLVEIITAMKAVDFSRPQNEVNLAGLAADRIGKNRLDEIIDPFVEPHCDAWTLASVSKAAELAFRCLAFDRDARPSMAEVAAELEAIRASGLPCSPSSSLERKTEEDSPVFSIEDSWRSRGSSASSNSSLNK